MHTKSEALEHIYSGYTINVDASLAVDGWIRLSLELLPGEIFSRKSYSCPTNEIAGMVNYHVFSLTR